MLLEQVPDPESQQEGQGGQGHDHNEAARSRIMSAAGVCLGSVLQGGFPVFRQGIGGRLSFGHGRDLA